MKELNAVVQYWLKPATYNTAVGIYATVPLLMVPALFVVNAPYGNESLLIMQAHGLTNIH